MILALTEECPIFQTVNRPALDRVLGSIIRGQNIIATPPPRRLRAVLSDETWGVYGEILNQSYKRATQSPRGWSLPADCSNCDPDTTSQHFSMATVLLVENAGTDGGWLRLVIARLRPRLGYALRGPEPLLDIRQAGGVGEIPKELRRVGPDRSRVRPAGDVPGKTIAVADSDSIAPGQESDVAREVRKAASEVGADAHILQKRSIENYVPDEALRAYAKQNSDLRSAIDFVLALAPLQRDHYPLKSGLKEAELAAGLELFPATSTPPGIKIGDFMASLLEYRTHTVDASGLRLRDHSQELELLLDIVEGNL